MFPIVTIFSSNYHDYCTQKLFDLFFSHKSVRLAYLFTFVFEDIVNSYLTAVL